MSVGRQGRESSQGQRARGTITKNGRVLPYTGPVCGTGFLCNTHGSSHHSPGTGSEGSCNLADVEGKPSERPGVQGGLRQTWDKSQFWKKRGPRDPTGSPPGPAQSGRREPPARGTGGFGAQVWLCNATWHEQLPCSRDLWPMRSQGNRTTFFNSMDFFFFLLFLFSYSCPHFPPPCSPLAPPPPPQSVV